MDETGFRSEEERLAAKGFNIHKPDTQEESLTEKFSEKESAILKEPRDMIFEEFSQEYNSVMQAVAEKEKRGGLDPHDTLSYRPITQAEKNLLESNWKEFSRQRGFSGEDIDEYERWLTLSGQRDNLPGAINDPWRRNRPDWERKLYQLHLATAQQNGNALFPETLEQLAKTQVNAGRDQETSSPVPLVVLSAENEENVW